MYICDLNTQFASKQMGRSAKKCEKEEKAEKLKLKKVRRPDIRQYSYIYALSCIYIIICVFLRLSKRAIWKELEFMLKTQLGRRIRYIHVHVHVIIFVVVLCSHSCTHFVFNECVNSMLCVGNLHSLTPQTQLHEFVVHVHVCIF